jgi:hypothetical protein
MPLPENISASLYIIPVNSHQQARSWLRKPECRRTDTIIYYLVDEAKQALAQNPTNPALNVYIFHRPSQRSHHETQVQEVELFTDEPIPYNKGTFSFNNTHFTDIDLLLAVHERGEDKTKFVLKQHVIAHFLNNYYAAFADTKRKILYTTSPLWEVMQKESSSAFFSRFAPPQLVYDPRFLLMAYEHLAKNYQDKLVQNNKSCCIM